MNIVYIALIIALDQVTKYVAKLKLFSGNVFDLIPGYFSLTYVENRGAAFGIFRNNRFLLVGVTGIIILFMIYYLYRCRNIGRYMRISLILIIAGAMGNLIDRVFLGYVVDFFHFHIKDVFDWPVFNVADISVVCGTILLALNLIFVKE